MDTLERHFTSTSTYESGSRLRWDLWGTGVLLDQSEGVGVKFLGYDLD